MSTHWIRNFDALIVDGVAVEARKWKRKEIVIAFNRLAIELERLRCRDEDIHRTLNIPPTGKKFSRVKFLWLSAVFVCCQTTLSVEAFSQTFACLFVNIFLLLFFQSTLPSSSLPVCLISVCVFLLLFFFLIFWFVGMLEMQRNFHVC